MALTAEEQKLLDQLEASLRDSDPSLAAKFQPAAAKARRNPKWVVPVCLTGGFVLLAVGMMVFWPLCIAGFLTLFIGAGFFASRTRS